MFPTIKDAINAAKTLKAFGQYLNTIDTGNCVSGEMKNILYKFNVDRFVQLCNIINEPFTCPCPFASYTLEELKELREQAIKAGQIKCVMMLDSKIKEAMS